MPAAVKSKDHVATYKVLVGGADVDQDVANRVREIRVEDSLGLPDVCTVLMGYPKPAKAGDPHLIDKHPFTIGKTLQVKLGETETQRPSMLFEGEICTLEPSFGSGGVELRVRAYDVTHRLHRSRRTQSWQNKTASDIVKSVLSAAGVTVGSVDSSGGAFKFMQQDNETDWEFIWRLANRVGFEVKVDGTKVNFVKPKGGQTVELTWASPLRTFNPRVTAVQQVDKVTVLGFDPKTKEPIQGEASSATQVAKIGLSRANVASEFSGDSIHVATAVVADKAEADRLAKSLLDRIANSYVAADGICQGNPKVRAGAVADVKGVGKLFSGTYRVQSSIHLLKGGGGYETVFSSYPTNSVSEVLGLNGSGGGGATGATAFADQIVLAKVTNNKDPDGMGRVKLEYPALGKDMEGNWARIASPAAGKERGLMMLPVVGEEVLVAFENGDTTRPYVIGSLFNGKDTPGKELAAEDGSFGLLSDKKIITRAKEEIELEGGKTYTVKVKGDVEETFEAKMTTTITGELKIEVKQGGMTLKSTGPAKMESSAKLDIKATGGVTIDGTSMVTVKGGSIMIG